MIIIKNKNVFAGVLDKSKQHVQGKHTNLSREFIIKKLSDIIKKHSQLCGITLTLKMRFQDRDPKNMHLDIQKKIVNSKVWDNKYVLIPEFSPKGHLHYHGIIYDHYNVGVVRMSNMWARTFGFTKIEFTLHHPSEWIKYMMKDLGKTGLNTIICTV